VAVDPARLADLFDTALDAPPDERKTLLDRACAGDPPLRAAVEALLRADGAAGPEFLAAPPQLPPDAPPRRLGRYDDLRRIGEGGMGEVYAARDLQLGREVALKLLRARSPHARELLIREGIIHARLTHPNVVPLFDVGEHDDLVYLVMELVDGVSLRTWLKDLPQGWPARLRPLLDAARGLAAAHDVRLVHGDIKPDNLLLGRDGRARVVDFGVAGIAEDAASVVRGGTPSYMAPEVAGGAAATQRSDQYGFCVTAHECLHGARPPARDPALDLPPRLEAALNRGLARDPIARFLSMHSLIRELEAVLGRDPDTDLSIARGTRTAVFVALVVVSALVDLVVHVRGFGGPLPDADDLVRLAAFSLAGIGLAVAVAWARLRTRINRQFALLVVLTVAAMLAHRLIAARFGEDGAAILATDMALIGAMTTLAGLYLQTWILIPALTCLAGAATSTLAPQLAPIAVSVCVWTSAVVGLLAFRARPA
jgi:serine/threonine-protein kinase